MNVPRSAACVEANAANLRVNKWERAHLLQTLLEESLNELGVLGENFRVH